jgi:hypothetical protein
MVHAITLHLILSLTTGHVSPQFLVQFDDLFENVHGKSAMLTIWSEWQQRVGLSPKGEVKERTKVTFLDELVGGPRSSPHDNQKSTIQASTEELPMDATENEQIAPSTMDMVDQMELTDGMNRDGEAEAIPINEQQQSRYGKPKDPLPEWSKAESRPGHNKIEHWH